jgi:hypothetical protein
MKLIMLLTMLVVVCSPFTGVWTTPVVLAAGTTYYVDSTSAGNDSNNGTSTGTPWKNLSKVNSITFVPGDRILFKAGGSWSGQLHPLGSGNSTNTITIDKYGSGSKPIIAGGGAVTYTLYLDNQQYWDINNLEITNQGATAATGRMGVNIVAHDIGTANHVHLVGLSVHNVNGTSGNYDAGDGIMVQVTGSTTSTKWNDILIDSCTIYTINRVGIFTVSSWANHLGTNWGSGAWSGFTNVVIQNNTVYDITGDGILPLVTDGVLVQNNVVHDVGTGSGLASTVGIWTGDSNNVMIQNNEVYNSYRNSGNYDGQAFDLDNDTLTGTLQYNYSHDNPGGGFFLCQNSNSTNSTVRYNISQNDQSSHGPLSFACTDVAAPLNVYNNTFYLPSGSTASVIEQYGSSSSRSWNFKNNIIYNLGSGGYAYPGTGVVFDYNVFYGSHPGSEPADSHKLTSNPLLANAGSGSTGRTTVDGYKLQSGSPALTSGVLISGNGGLDYWGNSVSSSTAPNRGAYNGAAVAASGIGNPGFETGSLSPWSLLGSSASVTGSNVHSGSDAVQITAASSGVSQTISGLSANTTYVLKGWSKNAASGDTAYIGVKNYGGSETSAGVGSTSYAKYLVTFTTGSSNTTAEIYFWKNASIGNSYADDFEVVPYVNMALNPGFESGALGAWGTIGGGSAAVTGSNAHMGTYSVQITAASSGIQQTISGLTANTTYIVKAWSKNAASGDTAYVGVKNYGGAETNTGVSSTSYAQYSFTFTTGSSNTTADLYFWKNGSLGNSYVDDYEVIQQ